ncbi:hypothetical protein JL721_5573 [Aureococcus anophagefferens]|nr:hypothetical protein JL721_5573 [Aureococcus anophagefferens]
MGADVPGPLRRYRDAQLLSAVGFGVCTIANYVFAPSFFALMAADGVFVALVNVASIDCGGTDLIAARLGLGAAVTDELRDQFNALHQLFLADGRGAQALPSDASYVASLDGRLLWRVFFLAIDTAVEDAVVAVVLPALANELACHPHGIATTGAAYAEHCDGEWRLRGGAYLSVIVAVGKIGGVLAGVVMHARAAEHQAQGDAHYRKLFKSSLLGGLSFLGVPAVALGAVPGLGRDGTYALICLATFGFFLLMTMPKIGFATLLQHMATASDAPGASSASRRPSSWSSTRSSSPA